MPNLMHWNYRMGCVCPLCLGRERRKEGREVYTIQERSQPLALLSFLCLLYQRGRLFFILGTQRSHLKTGIPAAEGGTDGNSEAVCLTAINQLFPHGLEHTTVFPAEQQRGLSEPTLTSVLRNIDMMCVSGLMGVL